MDKHPTFTMHFPNTDEGTIELTILELDYLIKAGEVKIKADHVRASFFPILTRMYVANGGTPIKEEK